MTTMDEICRVAYGSVVPISFSHSSQKSLTDEDYTAKELPDETM